LYAESGASLRNGRRKGDSRFQPFDKRKPQVKGGKSKSAPFRKRRMRRPQMINPPGGEGSATRRFSFHFQHSKRRCWMTTMSPLSWLHSMLEGCDPGASCIARRAEGKSRQVSQKERRKRARRLLTRYRRPVRLDSLDAETRPML
jgi:hypothetical protein